MASRVQLNPNSDLQNEIQVSLVIQYIALVFFFLFCNAANLLQRLESRIDMIETKMSTNEQNLINKTAEKLSQMLPYGQ